MDWSATACVFVLLAVCVGQTPADSYNPCRIPPGPDPNAEVVSKIEGNVSVQVVHRCKDGFISDHGETQTTLSCDKSDNGTVWYGLFLDCKKRETICGQGWTYSGASCFKYSHRKYYPTKRTFQDAEEDCVRQNAHLLTLGNSYEDGLINELQFALPQEDIFLGLRHLQPGYYWQDGRSQLGNYRMWDSGEPKAANGECVARRYNTRKWYSVNCSRQLGYVCQRGCEYPYRMLPSGKCIRSFGDQNLAEWRGFYDAVTACHDIGDRLSEQFSVQDIQKLKDYTYVTVDGSNVYPYIGLRGYYDTVSSEHFESVLILIWYESGEHISPLLFDYRATLGNSSCFTSTSGTSDCTAKRPYICERRRCSSPPPAGPNAYRYWNGSTHVGYSVEYRCKNSMQGYWLRCSELFTWRGQPWPCTGRSCSKASLRDMVQTSSFGMPGTASIQTCGQGYTTVNSSGITRCVEGVWVLPATCEGKPNYCEANLPLTTGMSTFNVQRMSIFSEATYQCKPGYAKYGGPITCERKDDMHGVWTGGECKRSAGYCYFSDTFRNTVWDVDFSRITVRVGDTFRFRCVDPPDQQVVVSCMSGNSTQGNIVISPFYHCKSP